MNYINIFENFSFEQDVREITTLCLIELEDNNYDVSVNFYHKTSINNLQFIVSIGRLDGSTNLMDIEEYLMVYMDLIKSKPDIKISNIVAFLKNNCEGYNSNRVSINHIQKETLDFNGNYDNFFTYIRNKPMRLIMFVIEKNEI